jgi:hypothetical protein
LLINTKAPPITSAIIEPAIKLAIKFPNEGVIFLFPVILIIIKLKIVILTTLIIVSAFRKKISLILFFAKSIKIFMIKLIGNI